MKVILVHPFYDTHIVTPHLGLGYLAGTLLKYKHSVEIIDCVAYNISNKKLIKIIKDKNPDIIGITVMSLFYNIVKEIVADLRKECPNVKIVIGGSHITALPEQSMKEISADFAIIGEGEETFKELANGISLEKINGLVWRNNLNIIINPPRELIKDLDDLPFPAWNLINPNKYPHAPHGAISKRFPTCPIMTTRGCPYNCLFCASKCTWKKILRFRSTKNIVDEIEYLHNEFGIEEFHMEDDNITHSKEHLISLCNEIIKRNLDIVWTCPNGIRIDKLDEEMVLLMKQSGCYLLAFGIESGSQKILDSMNKHLDLKKVPKILKMVKSFGIETWGFFLIGLPGETKETVIETIKFSLSIPLDRAQFSMLVPLPGTEIYKGETDWGNMCYSKSSMYSDEFTKLQKKAFFRFYMRPRIALNMLIKIKPEQYKWIIKRLYDYLKI